MLRKDIALIVGAGAVENAWEPIRQSIQPVHIKTEIDSITASAILARIVYNMRFFKNNGNEKAFTYCKGIYEDTKRSICQNIKTAQEKGIIKVRTALFDIVARLIIPKCNRVMLISSNWDTVVDDALKALPEFAGMFGAVNIETGHIHGNYLNPEKLYLPSEIINENYRLQSEINLLGKIHSSLMRQLPHAEIIIIYGLSLSPLDAELMQAFGSGLSQKLAIIYIVDPCHKSVAERVNIALLPEKRIEIIGFKPDDLDTPHNHSFWN